MLLLPCRRPENISSPCLGTFKITYKDEKNPVALLLKLNGPIMVTCITDEDMKVTFSPAEVDRMRRTLIFMTQAARTIWFVSTDIFKNQIGNTYCPPKSRRFDTSYWQAGSVSVTHTLTLSTFTTLRVKSRTTQFMSTRWLRCVCPYARASDSVEEQEYFNLKQATVNSKPYRTPRRQEVGGPK